MEGPGRVLEGLGVSWRVWEGLGRSRLVLEKNFLSKSCRLTPETYRGGSGRVLGGSWEGLGGSWRVWEGPGGSGRIWAGPREKFVVD